MREETSPRNLISFLLVLFYHQNLLLFFDFFVETVYTMDHGSISMKLATPLEKPRP
jgi:hypothetical protein